MMRDIFKAVRTRQWAKNVLLFAGFVFAGRLRAALEAVSGHEMAGGILARSQVAREASCVLLAFVCFCALSGAAYLLNDWCDIERDRMHPIKKNRPLAAGRISTRGAAALLLTSLVVALSCGVAVEIINGNGVGFGLAAIAYFGLTIAYSFALKNIVLVDVLIVAAGFVVRVVAGCLAVPVKISPWIVFCTFCVALFIALCKRRAELLELGASSPTRGVLAIYTTEILSPFIAIAAGLTITSYSLYTFDQKASTAISPAWRDTPVMMATIPFVVYGVFRYLLLAYSTAVGGEPETMLRDRPFMINAILWALLAAALTLLS